MNRMTDEELMRRVTEGDEEALIELHQRYVNLVYSMAYRVLNDGREAEEATQDVFMKVWQRAYQYDPAKGLFKSWLLTVARRSAIDRLRSIRRKEGSGGVVALMDDWQLNSSGAANRRYASEQADNLRHALGDLPEEQRRTLVLAYFGGLSQTEIADHLNVPLGTVKTRIRLGMMKLRAALTLFEGN